MLRDQSRGIIDVFLLLLFLQATGSFTDFKQSKVGVPYLASEDNHKPRRHVDKAQRGFKRYQAAWDEAVSRRNHGSTIFDDPRSRESLSEINPGPSNTAHHTLQSNLQARYASPLRGTLE